MNVYSMRGSNTIPFHIPHKRLLEKIEHKEVEPEPLVSTEILRALDICHNTYFYISDRV